MFKLSAAGGNAREPESMDAAESNVAMMAPTPAENIQSNIQIRKDFPESWIFQSFNDSGLVFFLYRIRFFILLHIHVIFFLSFSVLYAQYIFM